MFMKHFNIKRLLLALACFFGIGVAANAQNVPEGYMEVSPYTENFSKASASSSSTTLPVGWTRLEHKIGNASTYYTASTLNGLSGKAFGNTRGQLEMYNSGSYVNLYDYIITPQVKGTISFRYARYSTSTSASYKPTVEVYKMTYNDGVFSCNPEQDLIYSVADEDWPSGTWSNIDNWRDATLNVENYEYLGFRISYAYIGEFTSTSAIIPIVKQLSITGSSYPNGNDYNANPDGSINIKALITIQNQGNVRMSKDTEDNYTMSLARLANSAGGEYDEPFITQDIPDLEPGESKTIEFDAVYDVPYDLLGAPNSSGEVGLTIYALDNWVPNNKDFKNVGYIRIKPYKAIMDMRFNQHTSKKDASFVTLPEKTYIYYGASQTPMTKTFQIKNSGPALMTVTAIEKPDWVTISGVELPFTVENGTPVDVDITLGGEPGYKEGTVKFIFDGIAIRDNANISGEIIPAGKYFEDFESEDAFSKWYAPSGSDSWSVAEYVDTERSANSYSSNNYYWPEYNINDKRLQNGRNNSPEHNLYSPLMKFEQGDKISFKAAKRTNSGSDVKLIVSYSADRANWTELGTIKVTNTENPSLQFSQGSASSTTSGGQNIYKRFEFDMPEGEYYISFGAGYVIIDDFVGGELVDLPYDIISETAEVSGVKMVNNTIALTANFKNIGNNDMAVEGQTVTLYANGEPVATAEDTQAISAGEAVDYVLSYVPHKKGETTLYSEIVMGDYKVVSPSVVINVAAEAAVVENQIGEPTNTSTTFPLALNFNNSRSEFVYTTSDLKDLKGEKIIKISYPYYKTTDSKTNETLEIWMENTSDEVVGSTYRDVTEMTKVLELSNYTFEKAGSSDEFAYMEFTLDNAFDYDPAQNLRVTVRSIGPVPSWAQAYFGRTKETDRKVLNNQVDSRDSFITGESKPSTTTGGMPVIILSTAKEVPTVKGTVINEEGTPVKYAKITIQSGEVIYNATTDGDGKWECVIYQPEKDYIVTVSGKGYETAVPVPLLMIGEMETELSFNCIPARDLSFDNGINVTGPSIRNDVDGNLTSIVHTEGLVIPSKLYSTDGNHDETAKDIEWTSSVDGIEFVYDDETGKWILKTDNVVMPEEGDLVVTVNGRLCLVEEEHTFTISPIRLGDANLDGNIAVGDVVTMANIAVENYDVDTFCHPNGDIDGDGEIQVEDLTATVDVIVGNNKSEGRNARRRVESFVTEDALVCDDFHVIGTDQFTIDVRLNNTYGYAALQAQVVVPEGMKVEKVVRGPRAKQHDLNYKITDKGTVNFILYSLTNASFIESDDPLVTLYVTAQEDCGNIWIQNIHASDNSANGYDLVYTGGSNLTSTTGIEGIESSEAADVRYYDVNGIEVNARDLENGIYIRVSGGKAEKVLINK